jgi:hypothetical protein
VTTPTTPRPTCSPTDYARTDYRAEATLRSRREARICAEALRLGASALRADAESSAPGEIGADAIDHAIDLAAAALLDILADDWERAAAR